jgi:CCR4-NOT transcription complex subunit 3
VSAADVEKTMKKIEEGIVAFDQTWEQVYEADSQTLREKYETELKKEIKKLQKLREQVKSWVSKGEVRQKQPLIDAREVRSSSNLQSGVP